MRKIKLLLSLSFLLFYFAIKAQIIIASQPTKVEFENWYKFNSAIENELNSENQTGQFQAFLDYSIKGEYRKSQELDDMTRQMQPAIPFTAKQVDSIRSNFSAVDAMSYIIGQAKLHRITIINEAHHNPRHRAFTRSLLNELYNSGYTHIGLEALYNGQKGGTPLANGARLRDEKDSLLNDRKYPIRQSGTYTQEPQFGNLIREALELGFTVFSYEKPGVGSGFPREIGQAENIQAVMNENPNAKILIHCGLAHAYEGNYKAWGKAMAGQLKELTGINPLTINQVEFSEHSKPEYNAPLYNALSLKNSSVLVDKHGVAMRFIENEAFTDIAVIHPPTEYIHSRPSWLFQNGVKNAEMDISFIHMDFPAMVLAFSKGENIENAIPIDLLEVNGVMKNIYLALRSGKYTIIVVNIEGEAMKFDIAVK